MLAGRADPDLCRRRDRARGLEARHAEAAPVEDRTILGHADRDAGRIGSGPGREKLVELGGERRSVGHRANPGAGPPARGGFPDRGLACAPLDSRITRAPVVGELFSHP